MFSKLVQVGLPFMKTKQSKAWIISTYIIKDGLLSTIVDFDFVHFISGAFLGKSQLKSSLQKRKTLVERETESSDTNVSNMANKTETNF